MRTRDARAWPPYHLVEDALITRTERKLERLERLYHLGQQHAWDGRTVLGDLIAHHGPPRLPPERRDAALRMLSILLWGELAAWAISADLAERIDDVEAKMAATSQAHDEARHFYVLRDYLAALGETVPRLGGLGRRLLVGMQLLTESNALAIFRGLVEARVEPVLGELLPYYEKDESRHVGLGVMYLPRLLDRMTRTQAAGAAAFQLRCVAILVTAGMPLREDLRVLGIDPRALASHTIRLQDQILRDMVAAARGRRLKGIVNPSRSIGPAIFDFIHPPGGAESIAPWHRGVLAAWTRGARVMDRVLA